MILSQYTKKVLNANLYDLRNCGEQVSGCKTYYNLDQSRGNYINIS